MEGQLVEHNINEFNNGVRKESPEFTISIINQDIDDDDEVLIQRVKKGIHQFSDSESDGDEDNASTKCQSIISESRQDVDNHLLVGEVKSHKKQLKKRIQQFSDSESSDNDKENNLDISPSKLNSDGSEEVSIFRKKKSDSRIKLANSNDSSSSSADEALKNEQQQLRMKNKRNKLKEKFKSLITSRVNESQKEKLINSDNGSESDKNAVSSADDEETSIERIKQNITEKTSYKTTICDPDTSDEENYSKKSMPQKKKERKSAKLTSPKPIRMTAKQAMENMKKIKSESNRMLREKEVTLPYHRPKALSLKDIMSRRRPAVSSDGKSLPIKMNEEQLKQYAKSLEERQKEMMELCKSDTDEDLEESQPQPDMLESGNTNQSENSIETEPKEELEQTENMMRENDIIKSNDNTNTLVETSEKTNIEDNNIDEVKDNIDEPVSENDSDMRVYDNRTDNAESNYNKATNNLDNNSDKVVETVNNSMNSSTSNAEMSLVYNDSIEETNISNENPAAVSNNDEDNLSTDEKTREVNVNNETEPDSQLVSLHYDTEKTDIYSENLEENQPRPSTSKDISDIAFDEILKENDFSDDDDMINMDEIDNLIENAEIQDNNGVEYVNSPALIRDSYDSNAKPKLTGAPGMVIDLDGTDAIARKKLTGLELLKERFTYFAKLKTPEELEREKEKRLKPGAQHLKLKQELEEKIAEQRSLEWAKRLEEEKQQQMEMDAIRGDESEDDIEKIEAKLNENDEILNGVTSESEESEEEMQEIKEKPRKRNPMINDEAEVSDDEECANDQDEGEEEKIENGPCNDADDEQNNDDDSEDSSEESSESEDEMETNTKKGRILKAFEDSDEEDAVPKNTNNEAETIEIINIVAEKTYENKITESQPILDSQDEDLQLAQRHKSFSGDLFTSQESAAKTESNINGSNEEHDIGTQTFSILNGNATEMSMDLNAPEKLTVISETQSNDDPSLDAVADMCSGSFSQNLVDSQFPSTGQPVGKKLTVISETQPNDVLNLDAVVGMCSGSFSQTLVTSQFPSESQPIGEDILNLCTGKFYNNQFVSQVNSDDIEKNDALQIPGEKVPKASQNYENKKPVETKIQEDNNLKSILDELNDPKFEETKPKKYFMDNTNKDVANTQFKKKFIIDSDDETNNDVTEVKKRKKIKKKKLEKRVLQISDDEEDECEEEYENDMEEQDYMSDAGEDADRLVEYDSEENEVEIKPQKGPKKRKMAEFFEQEAELTSEDEWVGSGDEDEADLDRMEREEGDDDTFNQKQLQRELGQIHMRDVLDQDKREVRLIQELLFEDGDLGDGHRQRKFRWRNADGEEEGGTVPDEFADTQEEEQESEEQWRKQRHERELFLRQMQKQDEADEDINISINRTTIIKANLCSRTMSSLLSEAKASREANTSKDAESAVVLEKKSSKDIPSPKKAFTVFQQSYHGSLLSRSGGALSRLCALAAAAPSDDVTAARAPPSRNFVFAALTQTEPEPKVTKRKADTNAGTPRLVKKMKTEDKTKPRSSLLDRLSLEKKL